MKLKSARTCNGCKAENTQSIIGGCLLNYKVEPTKEIHGCVVSQKPLEKCKKPKTLSEFSDAVTGKDGE